MKKIVVSSQKQKQVIEITPLINDVLEESETKDGVCTVFVAHTTASITVADLDPGTDLDLLDALEAIIPKLKYRHPHDPGHVGDHIVSSVIGPSICLPYTKGKLILGTWQEVVLIELNGPKDRTIYIHA